jgi:hypothetical protein
MGHERVGALPLSKRWRAIVQAISATPEGSPDRVADIAAGTLKNVASRFSALHKDSGVQAAFAFLVSLATDHLPRSVGLASPEFRLEQNPPPIRIAKSLNDWIRNHADSTEYAELACRAAGDTIAEWTKRETRQKQLFDVDMPAAAVWDRAASAAGFCELTRSFFAHFTRRYLQYFLDREASAAIPSIEGREAFQRSLSAHVVDVSRHAFETAAITQSFAAGWFNNHAREGRPTDREIEGFLSLAFGKLQEELRREARR